MNINDFNYKSVIGFRHARIFSFTDVSGKIIDEIVNLNGKGDFPQECFVKVGYAPDRTSFRLNDEEETFIVDCNIDGIVITCDMLAEPRITIYQLNEMVKIIADIVFKISSGKNSINRIGILNYYKFKKEENSSKFLLNNLTKYSEFSGIPEQFLYRFSIKDPTIETAMLNEKYDYRNTIFTVSAEKSSVKDLNPPNLIDLQIDHQIYFNPPKNYSSDLLIEHFKHYENFISKFITGTMYKSINPPEE